MDGKSLPSFHISTYTRLPTYLLTIPVFILMSLSWAFESKGAAGGVVVAAVVSYERSRNEVVAAVAMQVDK